MLVSLAVHATFLCEQPVGSSDVFPNHIRFAWLCNRVARAACLDERTSQVYNKPRRIKYIGQHI